MKTLYNSKVLAVILARGGSKGIPKKNIYHIAGHPLIAYSITAAKQSKYISEIVVSTDSEEIAKVAKSYQATVPFLRPAELAGDKVPSMDALRHAALEAEKEFGHEFDYIVELPCVAPLRDNTHIDEALYKLHYTGCDSVISMVDTGEKHPTRLKKIVGDQIVDLCTEFPEPAIGSRRQDLKPISYTRNGAIYAMTRETLIDNSSRHGKDSRPYVMPSDKSINIDEPLDMKLAEFFINNGYCNNYPKAKCKILVTTPVHFIMSSAKDLMDDVDGCTFTMGNVKEEEIIKDISNYNGWICNPCPTYKIDEHILKHASNLKFIASTSTGTDHIDKEYCKENDIEVLCLRDDPALGNITASSEFTFNLVLSTVRKMPYAFDSAKAGNWRGVEDKFRGIELNGRTMGIIGYGRIGSNNAKYAHAFGMKVVAYDPFVDITDDFVTQESSYTEVLRQADVVLICVHLNDATRNMVDHRWFEAMKEGVYFINTSRGEIIDEDALLNNLWMGKIAAAGLDVISDEFLSDKSEHKIIEYAKTYDNLIVTPHIAGLTYDSELKAFSIILDKIAKVIK